MDNDNKENKVNNEITSIADMKNLINAQKANINNKELESKDGETNNDLTKIFDDNKKTKRKKHKKIHNFKKDKNYNFEKKTNKKIHKVKSKEKRKKLKRIIKIAILMTFVVIVCYLFKIFYPEYKAIRKEVYDKLSNMNEDTFKRTGNTEIYDKNGNIIAQFGNEKYEYVTYDQISPYITNGYIAKEDKNFMVHNGVDYKALIRAGWALVRHKGEITQGGSTITQQVVKNNILSSEQTYKRKITEALCAKSLEKKYNKNQIMEFYCNSNYYGCGAYGVEGACMFYFNKHANEVTLSEAAMIVATSNLPNVYNPVADYELCLDKRDEVLYEMYNEDYITEEEYKNAVDEKPVITITSENIIENNFLSSYALYAATIKVMELNGFEFKYTFDSQEEYEEYRDYYNEEYSKTFDEIKTGGYKIYTSLDPDIQEMLQESVDNNLAEFQDRSEDGLYELQSAAVCVDNQTNMVVAIVGGRDDEGYFNRGYQAKRQSGSTIKPLLDYGVAINEGYVLPGTVMEDKRVEYDGYVPQNANMKYSGSMTVRSALLWSVNTIAVQLYMQATPEVGMKYLDKMKFSSLAYADNLAPSLSIGGFTNGVTVVDMAKAYSVFPNDGIYSDNTCIVSMVNYDNSIDYVCENNETEIYTPDTAFMISDMLEQTFDDPNGSGYKYKTSNQYYAGKTGTTNDNKDVWCCGYSEYYTTAVWIGYDNPKAMSGITSGTYPTKILTDFMEILHESKSLEPKEFDMPDTIMLVNSSGEKKNVDYTENIYASRPAGWDYCSAELEEKVTLHEKENEDEYILIEAQNAVSEFEDYQITSVDEALQIKEIYNDVYSKVALVSDANERSSLFDRLAFKYELLDGELINTWNDAIETEKQLEQEKKDEENIIKAQESIEEAEKYKKDAIINSAEWYISALNLRTVYTDYVEELITNGKIAVERATIYEEEYADLSKRFVDAAEKARALPEEKDEISAEDLEYIENND